MFVKWETTGFAMEMEAGGREDVPSAQVRKRGQEEGSNLGKTPWEDKWLIIFRIIIKHSILILLVTSSNVLLGKTLLVCFSYQKKKKIREIQEKELGLSDGRVTPLAFSALLWSATLESPCPTL